MVAWNHHLGGNLGCVTARPSAAFGLGSRWTAASGAAGASGPRALAPGRGLEGGACFWRLPSESPQIMLGRGEKGDVKRYICTS